MGPNFTMFAGDLPNNVFPPSSLSVLKMEDPSLGTHAAMLFDRSAATEAFCPVTQEACFVERKYKKNYSYIIHKTKQHIFPLRQ